MTEQLLPPLTNPSDALAVRVGTAELTYRELAGAAAALAAQLEPGRRVAVWATSSLETCVAVVAALAAGAPIVPLNPRAGRRELAHVVGDSAPDRVIAASGEDLPEALADVARLAPQLRNQRVALPATPMADNDPAVILYTSGTTGPPKGAIIPRRALASNLDALARVWAWTPADRLVHGLPLFHVHGLILGILGPFRLGGSVEHVGRFSPDALTGALRRGATMVFGVPTMYNRIAAEARADPAIADAFAGARLLVSGSAALPGPLHAEFERLTGQRIVERYGMTETLMNLAVRVGDPRPPGYVGRPLPGVEMRLIDDDGTVLETCDDETIGEILVRGPNVFSGYVNRPDATSTALRDGWFHTGDLATRRADGYVRIVGRRATDLIKSGGYKIGAGEIESALLEHPAVAEAAVAGRPDDDLGERIVAWVVPADGTAADAGTLISHVGELLSAHKRPREVHFVNELPRNALGKVVKQHLP
jgi:malonyl-CoA/methylmalonyl-CoA synthetase